MSVTSPKPWPAHVAVSPLRDELQAQLDDYVAAWIRGDQEAILGHLDQSVVLLPHDGLAPLIGVDAARAFWFGGRWPAGGIDSFTFDLQGAQQLGAGSAVAWGSRYLDYWQTELGLKASYEFRGTVLLVFTGSSGTWAISYFMWDDPPAKPTESPLP